MHETHTILLAAGLSRRMGAQNKLLLPIQGSPMVRHMAELYLRATSGPVTVVTGHDAPAILDALGDLPFTSRSTPISKQKGNPVLS